MSKAKTNQLALKIRRLRSNLDLTQEQFAAKVGCDLLHSKPLGDRKEQAITSGYAADPGDDGAYRGIRVSPSEGDTSL